MSYAKHSPLTISPQQEVSDFVISSEMFKHMQIIIDTQKQLQKYTL